LSIEDETILEYAPKFIKKLPEKVKTQEKEMTKFEVKVIGQPKPQIKWLKEGEEIIPSEEYLIENFNDGTSILIINDIYPDDTGTITFEAHNPLGVIMTTTELVVEGTQTNCMRQVYNILQQIFGSIAYSTIFMIFFIFRYLQIFLCVSKFSFSNTLHIFFFFCINQIRIYVLCYTCQNHLVN
jgi:hypothetical protein